MSNYIIKIKNTSGDEGTIIPDVGFSYTDNLSEINQANIKISGSSSAKRSLIEMGSLVNIYRGGTLEFKGLIDSVDYLPAGGMSIKASGWEIWLAKENGDYAGSPWTSTASATIFNAILGECSQPSGNAFSAGIVNAGTSVDFRAALTESLWNSISNLISKTGQDIGIDYINQEIDILDHKGSSTSVMTLNAGIQMANIRVTQSYPIGNDVRVYGEGEGSTRIISNVANGQDATSKSNYGTIRKIVRDPSITTQAEANLLADTLVAVYKDPVKIYDFDVLNPNQSVVAGDVITLNAKAQGLDNEEVRVVGITKGIQRDREILTYQVTNKAYSRLIKKRDEVLAEIDKNNRDNQTYNQYQSEYSNQNCATCVGGSCSYFEGSSACLFGHDINSDCIGNYTYSVILGCCAGFGGAATVGYALSVTGFSIFGGQLQVNTGGICVNGGRICVMANPVNPQDAATKCYVDACAGGGSSFWADGTNPYIIPCNSCGICVSQICATTCITTNCIGIGGNSACELYVSGNGVVTGTMTITYSDTTCACASRRMVLPVGTNCY